MQKMNLANATDRAALENYLAARTSPPAMDPRIRAAQTAVRA